MIYAMHFIPLQLALAYYMPMRAVLFFGDGAMLQAA